MTTHIPSALFACGHNAGRSQMAAGFLQHLSKGRAEVRSARLMPTEHINPVEVAVRSIRDESEQRVRKLVTELL